MQTVFSTLIGELKAYLSGDEMSLKYEKYSKLKSVEQLQARKGNYLYTKLGFDPGRIDFAQSDPAAHFAAVGKNSELIDNVKLCFDQNGKIAAIDISSVTGGDSISDFSQYISAITINDWTGTYSDGEMTEYSGFDALSDLDKYYAKKGLELANDAGLNAPDFAMNLSLVGKRQFLADDSRKPMDREALAAVSLPHRDISEMTAPGALDSNQAATKKADETLNADVVNREDQSGENNPRRDESAIIKSDTKREAVAPSVTVKDVSEEKLGNISQIAVVSREEFSIEQEQVKGQEEVKVQEPIKEQEQTKGPELAKGRMSMASWKAQIAQMKANEESSKKQPSLKIKEVGRDR